jgi:4'-phosphopantetheinyl transferase
MTGADELPGTGRATVDVWRIATSTRTRVSADALSSDESLRLERRIGSLDRLRALAAWTAQREILATYLECAPRDVPLERDASGRPYLRTGRSPLYHSVAHSGDWAMLAVSRSARVGIDLERVDPTADVERLALRFFACDEAEAIALLPHDERAAAFFHAWTEKEAYLKGIGGGVPPRLRSVRAAFNPRIGVRAVADWRLYDLDAPPGYAACLAVRAPDVRICAMDFSQHGER